MLTIERKEGKEQQ